MSRQYRQWMEAEGDLPEPDSDFVNQQIENERYEQDYQDSRDWTEADAVAFGEIGSYDENGNYHPSQEEEEAFRRDMGDPRLFDGPEDGGPYLSDQDKYRDENDDQIPF